MKASPLEIITAHYKTYVDDATGKARWQDYALFVGVPLLVFGICGWLEISLPQAASVGLLTVSGLLSAFLFGAMLQVSQRAMDWLDTRPVRSEANSEHGRFLRQLAANAGYASLVSIVTATLFVIASATSGEAQSAVGIVGLALACHMALVLLMVMARVFALTDERLVKAEAGEDEEPTVLTPLDTRRHAG